MASLLQQLELTRTPSSNVSASRKKEEVTRSVFDRMRFRDLRGNPSGGAKEEAASLEDRCARQIRV